MRIVPLALLAGLGFTGSLAVATASDEPPRIVTVTVHEPSRTLSKSPTVQGKGVKWWAYRAVRNRKHLNRVRHALRTYVTVGASGLERAFLCIKAGEGAWTSRTGNGYYGGLQMDLSFQRAYAPDFLRAFGTADRWTPALQMATGIRAYLSGRGFGPWPATSRACGLR